MLQLFIHIILKRFYQVENSTVGNHYDSVVQALYSLNKLRNHILQLRILEDNGSKIAIKNLFREILVASKPYLTSKYLKYFELPGSQPGIQYDAQRLHKRLFCNTFIWAFYHSAEYFHVIKCYCHKLVPYLQID